MGETMFRITFWRPGEDDYCPVVSIGRMMDYDDTAQVCASLKARGYLVEVNELTIVKTPKLRTD